MRRTRLLEFERLVLVHCALGAREVSRVYLA